MTNNKKVYVVCRTNNNGEPLSSKILFKNRFICKIGVASNPNNRLKSLQTANPFNLELFANINTDNPQHLESILQDLYDKFDRQEFNSKLSLSGEWYYLSGLELTLLSSINKLKVDKLSRQYDLKSDNYDDFKSKIIDNLSYISDILSRVEENTKDNN